MSPIGILVGPLVGDTPSKAIPRRETMHFAVSLAVDAKIPGCFQRYWYGFVGVPKTMVSREVETKKTVGSRIVSTCFNQNDDQPATTQET